MIMKKFLIFIIKYLITTILIIFYLIFLSIYFPFKILIFVLSNFLKFLINFIFLINFFYFRIIKASILVLIPIVYFISKSAVSKISFPKTKKKLINFFFVCKKGFIIYFKYQNTFIYYYSLKFYNYILTKVHFIQICIFFYNKFIKLIKINKLLLKYIKIYVFKIWFLLHIIYQKIILLKIKKKLYLYKLFHLNCNFIFNFYKLNKITIHLFIHKKSNIYRTIIFFFQNKYLLLIFNFIWHKLKRSNQFNSFLYLPLFKNNETNTSLSPLNFSLLWYLFTIISSFFLLIFISGWVFLLFSIIFIINIIYTCFLFFSILIRYIYFNWKHKIHLIHLYLLSDFIIILSKLSITFENTWNWNKIYLLRKKAFNKQSSIKLTQVYYKISFLFLLLNINNSIKLTKLEYRYNTLLSKYRDTIYSSIFFRSKSKIDVCDINPAIQKIEYQFKTHQKLWQELGILGDNINISHNEWKTTFINQLTNTSNFQFFTKITNLFSTVSNKTWDKFKISNITDTFDDFSFYNNANLRIDHYFGDMSAASEEIGFLKHKRVMKNRKKFMNIFRKNLETDSLFHFKDDTNIIGLHKQNKISQVSWKTIYFLLRKHREFQWSTKRIRTVYKTEPFDSNNKAGLWNTHDNLNKLKYQQVSWPLFFSRVIPSIFYTFSFIHDFFFSFFLEFLSDFYSSQINLLKTAYYINQSLHISKFNNLFYGMGVILITKILWFCLFEVWKQLISIILKIYFIFKYNSKNKNILIQLLNHSVHWLLYLSQYLKINDYIIISYFYSYKWNEFFKFKFKSYQKKNLKFDYYKYGYFVIILDFFFFFFSFFILFCLDLLYLIGWFFFLNFIPFKIQQYIFSVNKLLLYVYYNTFYLCCYKLLGFILYYNLYYNMVYSNKYKFLSLKNKIHHMRRYNLHVDSEGNWLDQNEYMKFFLKFLIVAKITNKYWWSIKIDNKTGLESWPFFYNWFKILPEVKITYNFLKIFIYLLYYFSKVFLYFFNDHIIQNIVFLYQTSRFLSLKLTLKYIYWFLLVYFKEWIIHIFTYFFNTVFFKKQITSNVLLTISNKFYFNIGYKNTTIYTKYSSFLTGPKSTKIPVKYTKYTTAQSAFEDLYYSFDKKPNLEITKTQKQIIKHNTIKNNVYSFFIYTNLNYIHLGNVKQGLISKSTSNRILTLQTETTKLNKFKTQVHFLNLEYVWFTLFCSITNKLIYWVNKNNTFKSINYNFKDAFIQKLLQFRIQNKNNQLTTPENKSFNFFSKYFTIINFFSLISKKKQYKFFFNNKHFNDIKSPNYYNNIEFIILSKKYFFSTYYNINSLLKKNNNLLLNFLIICSNQISLLWSTECIYYIKFSIFYKTYNNLVKKKSNLAMKRESVVYKNKKKLNFFYLHIFKALGLKGMYYFYKVYKNFPQEVNLLDQKTKIYFSDYMVNKMLNNYAVFYQIKTIKEINSFFKKDGIKNKLYFQYTFLKDFIISPTKTTAIEDFLGINSSNQVTIDDLINQELLLLKSEGIINFDGIKQEWHLLNMNYFLELRERLKITFLNNFSSSRVGLRFWMLRLLFRHWRVMKRSRKFTSYFIKLFRSTTLAFNSTRRNAFAKWHLFEGSNYGGEAIKSKHALKIIREGEEKPSLKTFWFKFIEYGIFYNYHKKQKKLLIQVKKQFNKIYLLILGNEQISEQQEILTKKEKKINNNIFFKTTEDVFISDDNIFGKRVFFGFLVEGFLKKRPKLYQWKIKWFLWRHFSLMPYFLIGTILSLLTWMFGFALFFNLDTFTDGLIWFYQLFHVFFEQWLYIYYLIPTVNFSRIFLIDWFVIISSILDPFIFQRYFFDINLIFLHSEPIRLCVDILLLTMNNPYIIEDYSFHKALYKILLIIIYGIFFSIWKFYLFLTWTTIYFFTLFNWPLYLTHDSVLFIWDYLLLWSKTLFIYCFYTFYSLNNFSFLFIAFSYMFLIKQVWFLFVKFFFFWCYYNVDFYLYVHYIGWGDLFFNNMYILLNFLKFNFLKGINDFFFFLSFHLIAYLQAWVLYQLAILKLIIFKWKFWFWGYIDFSPYFELFFQEFIFKELFEYLIQIWLWIYFNCLYYCIVWPVKFFLYSVWFLVKKICWLLYIFPDFLFYCVIKILNIITISFHFFSSQFYLLVNFIHFIIIKPLILLNNVIIIPFFAWVIKLPVLIYIINYIKFIFIFMTKSILFPYYLLYHMYSYLGLDLLMFSFWFHIFNLYEFIMELFLFYHNILWNYLSGIWGFIFILSDIFTIIFPNFNQILYPFGGFAFFYAVFFYYIFIVFAILWSRSFRIFNDTTKELPVPDYIWERARFDIEGSSVYNVMPLHLYKLLWIEKLSSNKKGKIPQELLDSLDTWTIQEEYASYQLLVRLHDTPLNSQGFYYKYFTDLTRPFIVKYYRQRLSFKTRLRYLFPYEKHIVVFRRLKYALWVWYAEGYLALVTEEDPDAIHTYGPTPGEVAGREANIDGQFDILLTDLEVINKVKQLKQYNFYFMTKYNDGTGMAQDVWLTFPVIGHVFGQDPLKKLKLMKNRERFVFQFTPGVNQNKHLTIKELKLKNHYIENWAHLNKNSIEKFITNPYFGTAQLYSRPKNKLLDLKANPRFYKLNKYIKVNEDDGINPDFYTDFMYLGSRSLDLTLMPFLTFAAVQTAWWNPDNGMMRAAFRFLELSNVADVLIKDFLQDEFGADKQYKVIRQQFLSAFSPGELRYEFLDLDVEEANLIKYGKPLLDKNLDQIRSGLAEKVLSKFPEISTFNEDGQKIKTINDLLSFEPTHDIIDDILVNIMDEFSVAPIVYNRWDSSFRDLLLKDYYLGKEDLSQINRKIKLNLLQNLSDIRDQRPTLTEFTDNLRNMILEDMLFFTRESQWSAAFTDKIVAASRGRKVKDHTFGKTLAFKTPPLFEKDSEVANDIEEEEKYRRIKGASKEKLLEATTANYGTYDRSTISETHKRGAIYYNPGSIYDYHSREPYSNKELQNIVFINFFSDDKPQLILQKKDLKELSEFKIIDISKYLDSDSSIRIETNMRSASISSYVKPTRFQIESRDKMLKYLTNHMTEISLRIEKQFLDTENPSMINLYDECMEELLLGKVLYRTTTPSPAFGHFLKFYILQRLFSLYITAYEDTFFGDIFYYITRSVLVRSPVTGLDVLPLVALDINNNKDIYYTSGFYGLPSVTTLQKEFLVPYTQYAYTQHYLIKSLKQEALKFFTNKEQFLQQIPNGIKEFNSNSMPYLHPTLHLDKRVRMVYNHIYGASFLHPNIYNEGVYLVKLRELFFFIGVDTWLAEVKDMFAIEKHIFIKGWEVANNLVSWDFWIFFFRSDWIVFVEEHSDWFKFTFHVFGYLKREIDLYPAVWYSMHVVEYTKTFLWFVFDVTKFLYFPNMTLHYLRFDFWFQILSPFFYRFKEALNTSLIWWYNNVWFYRWTVDVMSFFWSNFINKNPFFSSIIYEEDGFYRWLIRANHILHSCVYWKDPFTLIPYIITPYLFLTTVNALQIDLYKFTSNWFIDSNFTEFVPVDKNLVFLFFMTDVKSFLFYDMWYDHYIAIHGITESKQKTFLSKVLLDELNVRYNKKLYPTLLRENIISPYSFKTNYGNYFLTSYEVNLLYNTDYYKHEAISAYNAFDFLLTNPVNALFYKNFLEIGDTKDHESGFLFNFQAIYQDLSTLDLTGDASTDLSVDTFDVLKFYEENFKTENTNLHFRLFLYKYFQSLEDYEVVETSTNDEILELIKQKWGDNYTILTNDKYEWTVKYNKHDFMLEKQGYKVEKEIFYFISKTNLADGNTYIYKVRYNNENES